MKFRRLGSFTLAAALMASSAAIVCYAEEAKTVGDAVIVDANEKDWLIRFVVDKKEELGCYSEPTANTMKIAGVKFYVTWGDENMPDIQSATGAICLNSPGTGWKQLDFGNGKTVEPNWANGTIEYKTDKAFFVETDKYEQIWLKSWTAGEIKSVDKIEIVDASGAAIWTLTKSGSTYKTAEGPAFESAAAVEEETPAETEAPAEETTAAETTVAPATEAPAEEPEADADDGDDLDIDDEPVDDEDLDDEDLDDEDLDDEDLDDEDLNDAPVDDGEIDWSQYDAAAMKAMNDEFKLGGKLDLYAILGDDWDKFTKIEADFTWTPGEKWCGGAGIGSAVNGVDGSTWIMGTEFGAANANEAIAPDGKATQTILDMGTPLTAIASLGDDGTWSFGELQVQNLCNGTEAGAEVQQIRFLDASGNVVAYFGEAAAPDETVTPATGDVAGATDGSKGSPDTGVADVAAVAGLAVVAAGAVIVAKKRK